MRSSYREEDVVLLLKDITGMVQPQSAQEREPLIQQGRHYCEMLPIEYVPSESYMQAYQMALQHFAKPVALAVGILADKILACRGRNVVLVSLARAGIPIGILLKHYIKWKYKIDVPHYSISIIRGKGIDNHAMQYLLRCYQAEQLQFVDGWVGKGAILQELQKTLDTYSGVEASLAVIADPAYVTDLCGTHEDILIPSCCLNCTVSGLISRTFLRDDIIGAEDFHGSVYYGELAESDLSYAFIHAIEAHFQIDALEEEIQGREDAKNLKQNRTMSGMDEVKEIAAWYGIADINLIKPGIGETTRVLLRRVPWKILVKPDNREDEALTHLFRLAQEKGVVVESYPLKHYKCCGLIRKMADT